MGLLVTAKHPGDRSPKPKAEWLAVVDAWWVMPHNHGCAPGPIAKGELLEALRFAAEDAEGDDLLDEAGQGDGAADELIARAELFAEVEAVASPDIADHVLARGADRRTALREALGTGKWRP